MNEEMKRIAVSNTVSMRKWWQFADLSLWNLILVLSQIAETPTTEHQGIRTSTQGRPSRSLVMPTSLTLMAKWQPKGKYSV